MQSGEIQLQAGLQVLKSQQLELLPPQQPQLQYPYQPPKQQQPPNQQLQQQQQPSNQQQPPNQQQQQQQQQQQTVLSQPQQQTVSSHPQQQAVSSQPQHPTVSSQPQHPTVLSQPQQQIVSTQPQQQIVSTQPQQQAVSSQPQPQHQTVSAQPQQQVVSSQPQQQTVSPHPQQQVVSSQPQQHTSQPQQQTVSSQPQQQTVSSQPQQQIVSSQPQQQTVSTQPQQQTVLSQPQQLHPPLLQQHPLMTQTTDQTLLPPSQPQSEQESVATPAQPPIIETELPLTASQQHLSELSTRSFHSESESTSGEPQLACVTSALSHKNYTLKYEGNRSKGIRSKRWDGKTIVLDEAYLESLVEDGTKLLPGIEVQLPWNKPRGGGTEYWRAVIQDSTISDDQPFQDKRKRKKPASSPDLTPETSPLPVPKSKKTRAKPKLKKPKPAGQVLSIGGEYEFAERDQCDATTSEVTPKATAPKAAVPKAAVPKAAVPKATRKKALKGTQIAATNAADPGEDSIVTQTMFMKVIQQQGEMISLLSNLFKDKFHAQPSQLGEGVHQQQPLASLHQPQTFDSGQSLVPQLREQQQIGTPLVSTLRQPLQTFDDIRQTQVGSSYEQHQQLPVTQFGSTLQQLQTSILDQTTQLQHQTHDTPQLGGKSQQQQLVTSSLQQQLQSCETQKSSLQQHQSVTPFGETLRQQLQTSTLDQTQPGSSSHQHKQLMTPSFQQQLQSCETQKSNLQQHRSVTPFVDTQLQTSHLDRTQLGSSSSFLQQQQTCPQTQKANSTSFGSALQQQVQTSSLDQAQRGSSQQHHIQTQAPQLSVQHQQVSPLPFQYDTDTVQQTPQHTPQPSQSESEDFIDDLWADDSDYLSWDKPVQIDLTSPQERSSSSSTSVLTSPVTCSSSTATLSPSPPPLKPVEQVLKEIPGKDVASLRLLAVRLARESIFGKDQWAQTSLSGRGPLGKADQKKLNYIRSLIEARIPDKPKVEYDYYWNLCRISLSKSAQALRKKR